MIPNRKKDIIVIKIVDWWNDKDEPAIDLEVYEHGVFDPKKSTIYSFNDYSKPEAIEMARRMAEHYIKCCGNK
jgi:hypothetical protein